MRSSASDDVPAATGAGRARRRQVRLRDLPLRKRIAFTAVLAVLPVLILALIEGALRLAGFGGYRPTFIAAGPLDDDSTLRFAHWQGPASYFFSGRSEALAMDVSPLVDPKPEGVFRVLWVGGSAAKGIPQPRPLRAASFFETMLGDVWPDREIEVINLATPGIASYPVLGVMTEALDYEPDLVVAYLGNNEFFGAYGVASLHSAGQSPAMIRLTRAARGTGIAQALEAALVPRVERGGARLMEAMVDGARIAPDDPLRDAAARTLETFVGDMIDRCRARGVPIIVCPPVANESGMFPLAEPDLSSLAPEQVARVDALLMAARSAADPHDAERELRALLAIVPHHATAHHLLGRALLEQERHHEADEEFHEAVDLDPMPWRPPTASVEAVRRAAASRGAVIADLPATFHAARPDGCIGWELMSDHVHPSLRGQALVARTVLRAMTRLEGDASLTPEGVEALPDWEVYADRLGRNRYSDYGVAHSMTRLGSISFFAATNPEMTGLNAAVCAGIEQAVTPPIRRSLRTWTDPERSLVDRFPITGVVAETLYGLGRFDEAEEAFRFAAECSDRYGSRRVAFIYYELLAHKTALGDLDPPSVARATAAIEEGRFLYRDGPTESGRAERYVGHLCQLIGDHRQAIPLLEYARARTAEHLAPVVDRALVESYRATGAGDDAMRVIRDGLAGPYATRYRAMLQPQAPSP